MKTLVLAILVALSRAQVFSGNQNCVACLGSKRVICVTATSNSSCFDAACPVLNQARTNILTHCSSIAPTGAPVRSSGTQCF